MANTKNKESMAYKNKLAYIKMKNKENKRFYVILHPTRDADIIDYLEANVKHKSPYVKNLIRAEIKKNEA